MKKKDIGGTKVTDMDIMVVFLKVSILKVGRIDVIKVAIVKSSATTETKHIIVHAKVIHRLKLRGGK